MPGLLGDGQNFKRRDKGDKVDGRGRGGEGGWRGGIDCTSLPAM